VDEGEKRERAGRVLRVHTVPALPDNIRTIVEVVAIVAAGLWALYTFVYEQRIKPLSEAPSFSVPTVIEQGSTVNGVAFLTIHKRLQNTGNIPVDIAAEALSVYGEVIVPRAKNYGRIDTPTSVRVKADVPRKAAGLLYSFAKLRSGAVGGDPTTAFYVPAHSANEETILVAVPVKTYPVILIVRRDYVEKAPISPKVPVTIVKDRFGAYDLRSDPGQNGEYDTQEEYAIRTR
jgi:hypothetical protein